MRSWLPRPHQSAGERLLAVEHGQVMCPRRGLVDLEACWACPAYRGLSTTRVEGVLCAPGSTLLSDVTSLLPTSIER